MGKKVIIAEKPSVGREYAKALRVSGSGDGCIENDEWIVTWTVGHLIAMSYPEKYDEALKQWKLDPLPFIPEKYLYEVIPSLKKQFDIVKRIYNRKDIDTIYYAGDSGREGLYIQMLVRMVAGHTPGVEEKVVWIDSQTEEEILRGVREAKPVSEYQNMSDSGYLRAKEDYLTGINFSRLLSIQYGRMLCSAAGLKKYQAIAVGRVMTCVLGMVVQREREIRNFVPTPFYKIGATIEKDGSTIEAEWKAVKTSKYFESPLLYSETGFKEEKDANAFISTLSKTLSVKSVEKSDEKKFAPALFNLAELQSECSKKLHISPNETLEVAQSLYEKKLTTYPRTDARVLTNAIAKEISKNITGLSKGAYMTEATYVSSQGSKVPPKYIDDSKVTDHYAIIPTGVEPKDLNPLEEQVYDMIVRRFLSIFYPPAVFEKVQVVFEDNGEQFFSSGKYLKTKGFYDVAIKADNDDKEIFVKLLSTLVKGEQYPSSYGVKKGETAPPKRYTSGSIILAMENAGKLIEDEELREQIKSSGIGTSATRGEVVEKLIRNGYIKADKKTQALYAQNFGEMIYEVVYATAPSLLSPQMTASWEKGLSQVVQGQTTAAQYEKLMNDYVRKECNNMKNNYKGDVIAAAIKPFAVANYSSGENGLFEPEDTGLICPVCHGKLLTAKWGYSCENYKKEKDCKFAIGQIAGKNLDLETVKKLLNDGKTQLIEGFTSKKGTKFSAFLIFDNETNTISFDFPKAEESTGTNDSKIIKTCPKCKADMIKTSWDYRCSAGCPVKLSTRLCNKDIPLKELEKLFTDHKSGLIKGFRNKVGKSFSAYLLWNEGDSYSFEFSKK